MRAWTDICSVQKRHSQQAGFTLIEMMMVLLIVGLMSAAVVLTIPDSDPAAKGFVNNMVRELNLAAQTSMLSGDPAALGVTRDGYAIYDYREENWAARPLINWPDNVTVRFEKDNRRLDLPNRLLPILVFEPTGQSEIFEISLTGDGKTYELHSAGDGRIHAGTPL